MEINWTVVTCFLIGLFFLAGWYQGWWKQGVTTVSLAILVFLLWNPDIAQRFIDAINQVLSFIWGLIPDSFRLQVNEFLLSVFGIDTGGGALQLDASDPTTWLIILIAFLAAATIFSRLTLPGTIVQEGKRYVPAKSGAFLGALLGGLNGFLIISLIREYLDGRNLPGALPAEITQAAGNMGVTASDFAIRIAEAPQLTILDSYLPLVAMGIGLVMLIAVFSSRVKYKKSKKGFRKIETSIPYGYQEIEVTKPKRVKDRLVTTE